MPSPFEEFTAGIRAGLSTLDEARQTARAAREAIAQARAALGDAAQGTERLSGSLAALEQAMSTLERADTEAAAADEEMRSYLVDIGASAGPGPPPSTVPEPASPKPLVNKPFPPRRPPDPGKVERVKPHIGDPKTVGHAYDADGQSLEAVAEQWSGYDGPGRGGPGLIYPHRHMTSLTEHVEGHVAAWMRTTKTKYVELYTNRHPCDDDKPNACVARIAEALPDDTYRLVVYSTMSRGGSTKRTIFKGNGRGVDGDLQ
ncbi:DddA-like double-stranded DNA deaminase toxin [Phytomonospora endophytica]|uniref:Nucleic acid/nucleotide deaminase of polymorphic system toxin n=1 Tax=Phytomonospora endophytica TaxID=714109 RepID=A0A841G2H4_9ACTN|nr:DddA-like double-stranded DNA deaminase toxin [Phytomonospora endophytica]MBB6038340.1 hypothetical protein [Phytomonospora endophytica]GIG64270.1 hypothetical protein Pen01_05650 [Phytomonospora endophytica]